MDRLKEQAAIVALNQMFRKSYFDITVVRAVAKMLDVNPEIDKDAWTILQSLHCVDYNSMTQDLRNSLPALIQRCLQTDTVTFYTAKPEVEMATVVEHKPGILKRLLGVVK